MAFTSKDVMDLRARTGVGMMDCKKALVETDGDMEKAIVYLREKGIASAAKKAGRIASQGVVDSYIHMGGKIGVLVEVNCETDFVANSAEFKAFVHDVAMQIAAMKPTYVSKEDVNPAEIANEKEILTAQALNEENPKPRQIIDKMVEGRISKYYKEVCLLEQDFFKDSSKTIQNLLTEVTAKIGEKISIRRFVRFEMGEGLEQRKDDYLSEISANLEKMQANK
jgi:translation elongation factor Ts/translation elongation factor Ts